MSSAMHAMSHREAKEWIIDTAASDHFCGNKEWFVEYRETPKNTALGATETMAAKVHRVDTIKLKVGTATGINIITLRDVLHTPQMRHNLISGSRIDAVGYTATIGDKKYKVFTSADEPFFEADLRDRFYTIDATVMKKPTPRAMVTEGKKGRMRERQRVNAVFREGSQRRSETTKEGTNEVREKRARIRARQHRQVHTRRT